MKQKDRYFSVLMLCDYNVPTGFGVVGENIVKHLKRHFGNKMFLDIIAVNYHGEVLKPDGQTTIYSAYKTSKMEDVFGRDGAGSMLKFGKYDFLFVINDIGVTGPLLQLVKKIKADCIAEKNLKLFKTVIYFPMDNKPMKEWFDHLDAADTIVTYTEWAKREICALRPDLQTKIKVIYHGTDIKTFFPINQEEKMQFREAFFGDNAKKIIFSNINRNQPRKDIPSTINAFITYRELYNKNSFLYLHMHPEDEMGWKLESIMQQVGLKFGVDYMYTPPGLIENAPDAGFMNCIYNASDYYITTTTGEGWGLGITEAMAAKLSVIAPNHTSITEISGNGTRLWLTEKSLHRPYISHYDNMVREGIDTDDFADKMNFAVTCPDDTAHKIFYGYEFVQAHTWEKVCQKWIAIFENLL